MRKEVIGDCELYLGDCREILPTLGPVDAVVTDPPYGMNWNTDSTRFTGGNQNRGNGRDNWGAIRGDHGPFDPAPWLNFANVVLWGSNHYAQALPLGSTLVWIKRHPDNFGAFLSDCEIGWRKGGHGAYAFYKPFSADSRAVEAVGKAGVYVHPTQKPLALMRWCLSEVPRANVVLDPFMGSGTTGVACAKEGRKFIGIEIDETYFNVSCLRIARAYAQPDLLVEVEAKAEQLDMLGEKAG
jgi:site-specific DNA-methyltransferase (adenine-specific)